MINRKSRSLHRRAMRRLELSIVAEHQGDKARRHKLLKQAMRLELKAIDEAVTDDAKAVLSKSAGALAFHNGELDLAKELATTALSYAPVAVDAEDLLRQIADATKDNAKLPTMQRTSSTPWKRQFGLAAIELGSFGQAALEWAKRTGEQLVELFGAVLEYFWEQLVPGLTIASLCIFIAALLFHPSLYRLIALYIAAAIAVVIYGFLR